MDLTIHRERLLGNLSALGEIGRVAPAAGGGLDRRPFSPAERQARTFFAEQAAAAGLTVLTDGAANLSARYECADPGAPTLLLGSHLDTVPHGGPYDGALGVMAALEVVRVAREQSLVLPWQLEAIAFTDEEGRLGDFFGSRAMAGAHTPESIAQFLTAAADYPDDLAAMRTVAPGGLTPDGIRAARRRAETLAGFLELHIEQGPRLEHAGLPIGVVTAIAGRRALRIVIRGRSDHAGTTPMDLRADALLAAARIAVTASDRVARDFPEAVFTCGNLQVKPGVYNVVPNEAELWVEFRAGSPADLAAIGEWLHAEIEAATAAPDLAVAVEEAAGHEPVRLDAALQAAVRRAADACGYGWMDLPSGALHDALLLAEVTPTAMIFVPSVAGRSHSPLEMTHPDDLVAGANVLLGTVLELARSA
jgi:hydantoinase/carbamoylase family amidase